VSGGMFQRIFDESLAVFIAAAVICGAIVGVIVL